LEGPGSGEWLLEGSGPEVSSCLMFPLLQSDAAASVAGAGLSYIGGQKLLINKRYLCRREKFHWPGIQPWYLQE
jgi:hypothetical protein